VKRILNTIYERSILIITSIALSGCAGINSIHNSREAMHIKELKDYGEAQGIDTVAIDTSNDTIYLCIQGNFLKEGVNYYQFTISRALRDRYKQNSSPIKLSYKKLERGCSFINYKNIVELQGGNTIIVGSGYSQYRYYLNKKHNSYRGDYGDVVVSVYNSSRYLNSVNRLGVSIIDERNQPSKYSSIELQSIMNENIYDPHEYESVGLIIDILTSIIQVPICVITLGGLCATSPHPYMNI